MIVNILTPRASDLLLPFLIAVPRRARATPLLLVILFAGHVNPSIARRQRLKTFHTNRCMTIQGALIFLIASATATTTAPFVGCRACA